MTPTLAEASPPAISATPRNSAASAAMAGAIVFALAATAYWLHDRGDAARSLSVLFGAVFGIVAQRARFCFLCNYSDWHDRRDARGLIAILVALGVGMVGTTLVFGAWLPDAAGGRLPPDAFIGPVSIALLVAGFVFGAGMAISGSCVSAHLYRLGEGSPTAPFALIGTIAGFMLGYQAWNPIYLAVVADAPIVWLPRRLGYAGALIGGLGALALLGWSLARGSWRIAPTPERSVAQAVFVDRWPGWIGGAAIGVLATLSYLRIAPLGVTAEIASRARQLSDGFGLLPPKLLGLDTLRGCVGLVRDLALSANGMFVLSLIGASFASALVAGRFKPTWPTRGQVWRGFGGGVLLGWGAMTALGCTVGTLLSGIMAGALSGWVFGFAVFGGVAATLYAGRRIGLLPA